MGLTLSSIFRLRSRDREPLPAYCSPGYPILPMLLVAATTLVVVCSVLQRPFEALYGAATIAAGLPFYYYWKRKNGRTSQ
jgi:basic amino acid/polyamine antiporter, APA family